MCQKNAGIGQGMGVTPKIFFVRHRTSPFLHWQWQCCSAAVDPASRRLNGTHLGTPRAPAQSRPHVRIYNKLYSGRRVALVTVVIQGARPSVITGLMLRLRRRLRLRPRRRPRPKLRRRLRHRLNRFGSNRSSNKCRQTGNRCLRCKTINNSRWPRISNSRVLQRNSKLISKW